MSPPHSAGQVYMQLHDFVYIGGNVDQDGDLSVEVDRCIRDAWCNFWNYSFELYDRSSASLKLKIWMLKAEVLESMQYGCVT